MLHQHLNIGRNGVEIDFGLRSVAHYRSTITTAEAIPASWDTDKCTLAPSTKSAITPRNKNSGLPDSKLITSASSQGNPLPALSALARASFAAKRAACEEIGSDPSACVKRRVERPGVRLSDCENLSISTTSIP